MAKKKDDKAEGQQAPKRAAKVDWFKVDGVVHKEEEFCEWLNTKCRDHPVVSSHHGKWKELLAWEEDGAQFSLYDSKRMAVQEVELNTRKKRVVINLMKPLIETIDGKLNFYYSVIGAPNSGEEKDIRGAEVSTKLLTYNDYEIGMDDVMETVKYDMLHLGDSAVRIFYDTERTGTVAPTKDGKVDLEKKATESGAVWAEVVPIFNLRPDPTAKTPGKMRWIVELKEINREELIESFQRNGKGNTGEYYAKMDEEFINSLKEDQSTRARGRYVIQKEEDDTEHPFLIKLFRERPSRTYKGGRYIVTCAGRVLYAGPNKNPSGELGYFFFYYRKTPYSFWSKGPLHYVQPIQREFNRMISMISEHLEAWRPKMAVPSGTLKRAQSMTVDNFELVEVDMRLGTPTAINMPEVSGQVTAYRDFLISSMDRVSNVHEVSYSRLPQYASRAPASLYSQMLEQENIKLGPMVKKINKTLVDMARYRLKLMDQHYSMPRMVKIMGEGRETAVEYFGKTDLNENFDVRLEPGVSINQSTTVQARLYIELFEKGILTEAHRNKILPLLNLGTAEHDIRTDVEDTDRAIRENQAFMDNAVDKLHMFENMLPGMGPPDENGQPTNLTLPPSQVYKHDDHDVHLDHHTTLMKSDHFQSKASDETKKALSQHIEEHLMWLQLAAQMAAPQQPGGAPAKAMPGAGKGAPGMEAAGTNAPIGGESEMI